MQWKHLLKQDKYKDVIIENLKFLVKEKRVGVNAFTSVSAEFPERDSALIRLTAGSSSRDSATTEIYQDVLVQYPENIYNPASQSKGLLWSITGGVLQAGMFIKFRTGTPAEAEIQQVMKYLFFSP